MATLFRSEEHTSELQSLRHLHSYPTRRSSDLALLGPEQADQIWYLSGVTTLVSSSALEPRFNIYQGKSPGQGSFKGGSITGSNDSSDLSNLVIYHGDAVQIGRAHV